MYFSNPFWTDPTDPSHDPDVLAVHENRAAIDAANAEAQANFKPFDYSGVRNVAIGLVLLFIASFVLYGIAAEIAPDSALQTILTIPYLIACIGLPLTGLLALAIFVTHRPRRLAYDQVLVNRVYQSSLHRYRVWLEQQRSTNPQLHAQILLWEQQQVMIRQQTEMIANQERSIRQQQEILKQQAATRSSIDAQRDEQRWRWQADQAERQRRGY